MKYPNKLNPGDTVGIICPSSPISEERLAQCAAVMEKLGYHVIASDNNTTNIGGYLADSGEARARELHKMFENPEIRAIFCIRGGDGGNRVMEYLDAELIRRNPKIFVGYSDITNFHAFLTQKCGMVTFHGPMVSSNIVDDFDPETSASLFQAINADLDYDFSNPAGYDIKVLQPGKARGMLTGGNLAVMMAGIGTPYEIDVKDRILFIEEVHESMAHIDRMLFHLRNSGKLEAANGIILGQFTNCENEDVPEYGVLEIMREALDGIDTPVLYNVQTGHGSPMMTIPFGAECSFDTETKKIHFSVERE